MILCLTQVSLIEEINISVTLWFISNLNSSVILEYLGLLNELFTQNFPHKNDAEVLYVKDLNLTKRKPEIRQCC